jgi:hypothetical protein
MAHLEHWLRLYESPTPKVKERAAAGLLGSGGEVPLRILLELLDSPNADLRSRAERALHECNDPGLLPAMVARLYSSDAEERLTACYLVARLDPALAESRAGRMLTDPDQRVREWARQRLRRRTEGPEMPPVDGALKSRVYNALGALDYRLGPEGLSDAKRHALLAWWARGIVGNGGLRYFYEGASEGDEVAEAYEALWFPAAAEAFRKSLAIFPNGRPHIIPELNWECLNESAAEFLEMIEDPIFEMGADLDAAVLAYLREHEPEFMAQVEADR